MASRPFDSSQEARCPDGVAAVSFADYEALKSRVHRQLVLYWDVSQR